MKGFDLIGIGFCGLDTVCIVPRIPIDDKVQIEQMLIQGGGPAATATVAAARLGLHTAFLGVVGDDARGESILEEFKREGVDTRSIPRRAQAESPAAYCWVEGDSGSRSIAWTHGGAPALTADEVDPEMIRASRALHCDGHQMAAALRAATIARENGIPVFLDAGTQVPGIEKLIAVSTVVIASQKFARDFCGSEDPEASARHLHGLGPEWTGVTLGPAGSLGFDGATMQRLGQFPGPVVDTTGAGDTYHGAFASRYLDSPMPDLRDCMRFATVTAGLKCRVLGGRTGLPRRQDVLSGMEQWQD